jgi:transcriptional regulator with XRE-family HTH domain
MKKPNSELPRWIATLRTLMEARRLNPRSLSLKAGLNPTAVRDMLEGRTRFPRYDTVQALSKALGVTPSQLMGSASEKAILSGTTPDLHDDMELLTEIISRLQEVAEDYQHKLKPRDFAAMVATIYRRVHNEPPRKNGRKDDLKPQIYDLLAYESLRRARG